MQLKDYCNHDALGCSGFQKHLITPVLHRFRVIPNRRLLFRFQADDYGTLSVDRVRGFLRYE